MILSNLIRRCFVNKYGGFGFVLNFLWFGFLKVGITGGVFFLSAV